MKAEASFPKMHVSLYVKDLMETVNFYTAFFGQPASKIKPGYAKYELNDPSLIISFVQNPERVQQNFGHLGFQVSSVEEMNRRLEASQNMGLSCDIEEGVNCCYATQDKFWVQDPDGVQWEVYYFHEDAEFNDPHYSTEDATACCTPPAQKQKVSLSELGQEACDPNSGCC